MKEAIQLPTQRRNDNEPVKVFHALRCACPAIRLSIVLHNLTAHVENVCQSASPEIKEKERALGRVRAKKSYYGRTNKDSVTSLDSSSKTMETQTQEFDAAHQARQLEPLDPDDETGNSAENDSAMDSKSGNVTADDEDAAKSGSGKDEQSSAGANTADKQRQASVAADLPPASAAGSQPMSQKSADHETVDLRVEVGLPRDEEIYYCQLLVSDIAPQVYKAHWTPTFCPIGVNGCDVSLERPVLRKRVFHSSLPPRFAVRRYVCHTHSNAFNALDPYMLTNLPDGVRLSRDVVVRGRSVATREFLSLLGVMWEDCGNVHTVRCNLMELWHRLLNECLGRLEVLSSQLRNAAPENRSLSSALPNEVLLREETKHLTELTERTVHDLLQAWSEAPQSFTYSPFMPTDGAGGGGGGVVGVGGVGGIDVNGAPIGAADDLHLPAEVFMAPESVVGAITGGGAVSVQAQQQHDLRQPSTTTVMVTSSEDHAIQMMQAD